jgi:hypothetical protein
MKRTIVAIIFFGLLTVMLACEGLLGGMVAFITQKPMFLYQKLK